MGMVTIDQVIRWRPCSDYPRKRINSLFAGRESLSWEDVVGLDIPTEDKLWALLREDFIPDRELHLLACDFAEKVLHLTDDPRCAEVIRVKRIWVDGKATYEELDAARDAARDAALDAALAAALAAARTAARDAARDAALDAALAAARAAALAAARAAARDAARDAARAAAWDAARAAQLAMTVEVLRRLA
jgi:hypothetical protein